MIFLSALERTARFFTGDLSNAFGRDHYATTHDRCPHCEEDTRWVARPLSGFYQCNRCGRNPLDLSDSDVS